AQDARHPRVMDVGADADPRVEAEVGTAVEHEAGMADVDVFTRLIERGCLGVLVGAKPGGHEGTHPRRQLEAVAAGDLERNDRRGERNSEAEALPVADERTLARLLEA